jgi:putative salt-induced outer membrane protein YdiY
LSTTVALLLSSLLADGVAQEEFPSYRPPAYGFPTYQAPPYQAPSYPPSPPAFSANEFPLSQLAPNEPAADPSAGDELPVWELPPAEDWFPVAGPTLVDWDGSIELGINGSQGAAKSFSMRAGGDLKRETEIHVWQFDFKYAKTLADSVQTQHYLMYNVKYERLFHSPWTMFLRHSGIYDEFKAYDLRLLVNAGLGYKLIDTDLTKLKGRAGGGVSWELGGPDDDYVPEGTFGFDFERQLTKRQKFVAVVDYYPAWKDFSDYLVVTDLGWTLVLDEASNLSLKVSLIDRYDSTPGDGKHNEFDYAILLLWKL